MSFLFLLFIQQAFWYEVKKTRKKLAIFITCLWPHPSMSASREYDSFLASHRGIERARLWFSTAYWTCLLLFLQPTWLLDFLWMR